MSIKYFKLDSNNEVLKSSIEEWENSPTLINYKDIKKTEINKFLISTIFVGISYDCTFKKEKNKYFLFETVIFNKEGEAIGQFKNWSYKNSLIDHEEACEWAMAQEDKN